MADFDNCQPECDLHVFGEGPTAKGDPCCCGKTTWKGMLIQDGPGAPYREGTIQQERANPEPPEPADLEDFERIAGEPWSSVSGEHPREPGDGKWVDRAAPPQPMPLRVRRSGHDESVPIRAVAYLILGLGFAGGVVVGVIATLVLT